MMKRFNEFLYIFILGSFIGYVFEVVIEFINGQGFINRGALLGPYLPIYGFGLVFLWLLLKKIKDKEFKIGQVNIIPVLVFTAIFIVTTAIELIAGLLINMVFKKPLWDYSHMLFHYKGIIALFPSFRFALGGTVMIYFLVPLLLRYLDKIDAKKKMIVGIAFLSLMFIDILFKIFT